MVLGLHEHRRDASVPLYVHEMCPPLDSYRGSEEVREVQVADMESGEAQAWPAGHCHRDTDTQGTTTRNNIYST
jgi:hypothetical protein